MVFHPLGVVYPLALGILNYGQAMFNTYDIAKPVHSLGVALEVAEFMGTIQAGGVPNDVVMDVRLIYMGGYDESVIAFQKSPPIRPRPRWPAFGERPVYQPLRLMRRNAGGSYQQDYGRPAAYLSAKLIAGYKKSI